MISEEDRQQAVEWARALLSRTDWVILDTETTGLSPQDEIIQIAILSSDGTPLFNSLIRPSRLIPASATAIHGITDDDVVDAPCYKEIAGQIESIVAEKTIVIYNADYDQRLLQQTHKRYFRQPLYIKRSQIECAMLMYSAWKGELWPDGNYKWQKLPGGDHTALGDCRATLKIIQEMAEDGD